MADAQEVETVSLPLRVSLEGWSNEAAEMLGDLFDPRQPFGVSDLGLLVEAGDALLFAVYAPNGPLAGYAVARFEPTPHGAVFVVMAAKAKCLAGVNYIQHLTPVWEELARASGCRFMRFHSARKGMGRALKPHGFEETETVYTKEL